MSIFELTEAELQRVEQRNVAASGICSKCRAQLNAIEQCRHIYCPVLADLMAKRRLIAKSKHRGGGER